MCPSCLLNSFSSLWWTFFKGSTCWASSTSPLIIILFTVGCRTVHHNTELLASPALLLPCSGAYQMSHSGHMWWATSTIQNWYKTYFCQIFGTCSKSMYWKCEQMKIPWIFQGVEHMSNHWPHLSAGTYTLCMWWVTATWVWTSSTTSTSMWHLPASQCRSTLRCWTLGQSCPSTEDQEHNVASFCLLFMMELTFWTSSAEISISSELLTSLKKTCLFVVTVWSSFFWKMDR